MSSSVVSDFRRALTPLPLVLLQQCLALTRRAASTTTPLPTSSSTTPAAASLDTLLDELIGDVVSRRAISGALLPLLADSTRLAVAKEALSLDASARDDDVARALQPASDASFEATVRRVCDANEPLRLALADALSLRAHGLAGTAAIVDELWLRGVQLFVAALPVDAVRELCAALGLACDGTHAALVERAFMHLCCLVRPKAKRGKRAGKAERVPAPKKAKFVAAPLSAIVPGVTAEQLRSRWNLVDLHQWCADNGVVLKSADKPKEKTIRAILNRLKSGAPAAAAAAAVAASTTDVDTNHAD